MKLVTTYDSDVECTKTKRPKLEGSKYNWYEIQGKIEDRPVKFYYCTKNHTPLYVYFEYDDCWYMADNYFAHTYDGKAYNLNDYIRDGCTFRIQRPYDEKENFVKIRDIAAFEMLSVQLFSLLKTIRKYNPTADICMKDEKLELYSYKQDQRFSASIVDSKNI